MGLPNFMVIGAARSGTTSLHRYLSQHPDIFMSPVKETNFFCSEEARREARAPGQEPRRARYLATEPISEPSAYRAQFAAAGDGQAIGEASPRYLYLPQVARRIHAMIPDIRLIAILRNPVQRAHSHYRLNRSVGAEPLDFAAALAAEPERIRQGWGWDWHYASVGRYAEQLERYLELFPRDRVHVLLYEDLRSDPRAALCRVSRFLQVDDGFEFDTRLRHNPAAETHSPRLESWIRTRGPAHRLARLALPGPLRRRLSRMIRAANVRRDPTPDPTYSEYAAAFDADVQRLSTLIGRDLSLWTAPAAGR